MVGRGRWVSLLIIWLLLFQAEDGIRDLVRSRGLGDGYKRQIQGRTAILVSEKYLEQDASGSAAKQQLSRRTEVQADCFAGEYVQSAAHSQNLAAAELESLKEPMYLSRIHI